MPAHEKFPWSRGLAPRVHILADHERPTAFREESQLINPLPTFIFQSISQPLKLLVSFSACIMHWELTQSEVLGLVECPGLSSERQLCLEGRGQCSTTIRVFLTTGQCFPALFLSPASVHILGVCETQIAIVVRRDFPRFGVSWAFIILHTCLALMSC